MEAGAAPNLPAVGWSRLPAFAFTGKDGGRFSGDVHECVNAAILMRTAAIFDAGVTRVADLAIEGLCVQIPFMGTSVCWIGPSMIAKKHRQSDRFLACVSSLLSVS